MATFGCRISLLLLLLHFLLQSSVFVGGDEALIHRVCGNTFGIDICKVCLLADRSAVQTNDVQVLAHTAIQRTIDLILEVAQIITDVMRRYKDDRTVRVLIECVNIFHESTRQLSSAYTEMMSRKYRNATVIVLSQSVAVRNCGDRLSKINVELPKEIHDPATYFASLCNVTVDIIQQLGRGI